MWLGMVLHYLWCMNVIQWSRETARPLWQHRWMFVCRTWSWPRLRSNWAKSTSPASSPSHRSSPERPLLQNREQTAETVHITVDNVQHMTVAFVVVTSFVLIMNYDSSACNCIESVFKNFLRDTVYAVAPFCGVDMPSRPLTWSITPRRDVLKMS